MAENVLAFFWKLASEKDHERVEAASGLLTALVQQQTQFNSQQEPTAATTLGSTRTEDELKQVCASDVLYAVKRLVRGLCSPRGGARQGFALALTEVLVNFPLLSYAYIKEAVDETTKTTHRMSKQETRDSLIGRLLGYMCLIESKAVAREGVTGDDLVGLVDDLLTLAASKSFLRAPAFRALGLLVLAIDSASTEADQTLRHLVDMGIANTAREADHLQLALLLQQQRHDLAWETILSDWAHGKVLHPDNLDHLVQLLHTTTHSAKDNAGWTGAHPIWHELLRIYFPSNAASTSSNPWLSPKVPFKELWDQAVNIGCLDPSAPATARAQVFYLTETALQHTSAEDVSVVLSPVFCQLLIDNLKSPSAKLFTHATQFCTALSLVTERRPELRTRVIGCLDKPTSGRQFDLATHTDTVARLLKQWSAADMPALIHELHQVFLDGGWLKPISPREAEFARQWVMHTLLLVMRKATKDDAVTHQVLQLLAVYGFMDSTQPLPTKALSQFDQAPQPPLSADMAQACQTTFFQVLAETTPTAKPVAPSKKLHPEPKPLSNDTASPDWCHQVFKLLLDLHAKHNVEFFTPLTGDAIPAVKTLAASLAANSKALGKANPSQREIRLAFQALFSLIGLQLCSDPESTVELVDDAKACFDRMFRATSPSSTKSKAKAKATKRGTKDLPTDSEPEPEPIHVLLDVIISMVAQATNARAKLLYRVFEPLVSQLTEESVSLIMDVLMADQSGADGDGSVVVVEDDEEDDGDESGLANGHGPKGTGMAIDSDSADSSDESDEDAADEEVDQELRQSVFDALGPAALASDAEEGSGSSDEELLDDDAMKMFDEKLSAIFATKAAMRKEQRSLTNQMSSFKLHTLTLVEIAITHPRAPTGWSIAAVGPLTVLLRITDRNRKLNDLHTKAKSILQFVGRHRPATWQGATSLSLDQYLDIVKDYLAKLGKRSTKSFASLLRQVFLYLMAAGAVAPFVQDAQYVPGMVAIFQTLVTKQLGSASFAHGGSQQSSDPWIASVFAANPTIGLACISNVLDSLNVVSNRDFVRLTHITGYIADLLRTVLTSNTPMESVTALSLQLTKALTILRQRLLDALGRAISSHEKEINSHEEHKDDQPAKPSAADVQPSIAPPRVRDLLSAVAKVVRRIGAKSPTVLKIDSANRPGHAQLALGAAKSWSQGDLCGKALVQLLSATATPYPSASGIYDLSMEIVKLSGESVTLPARSQTTAGANKAKRKPSSNATATESPHKRRK
ncbi:DNA-directed DNA polymerase [Dimargaris verticillata]|uniref:DNA-directed DNA polymerase n=1 Tax=Dimargaris verticillata TaxID=2761393 RepID=A0A9W8EBP8_9FUNG|nr:DNA-directed DNA polymerase [Dimargaris verticillata]